MKKWLVILAVCSFTAAMVPRERRALNEEEATEPVTDPAVTLKPKVCAAPTACAWAIYQPITRHIETNITNSYCNCGTDMVCALYEDDTTVGAYVYRCRPPSDVDGIIDSDS